MTLPAPGPGWFATISGVYDEQVWEASVFGSRTEEWFLQRCCGPAVPFLLWILLGNNPLVQSTCNVPSTHGNNIQFYVAVLLSVLGLAGFVPDHRLAHSRCVPALEASIKEVDQAYDSCNEAWARGEADKFRTAAFLTFWVYDSSVGLGHRI